MPALTFCSSCGTSLPLHQTAKCETCIEAMTTEMISSWSVSIENIQRKKRQSLDDNRNKFCFPS